MSFLDEATTAQAEKPRAGGNRCAMCRLIEEWGADGGNEGNELAVVLADRTFYASTIIEVLARRGVEVTDAQIGNHRREHVPGWKDQA